MVSEELLVNLLVPPNPTRDMTLTERVADTAARLSEIDNREAKNHEELLRRILELERKVG